MISRTPCSTPELHEPLVPTTDTAVDIITDDHERSFHAAWAVIREIRDEVYKSYLQTHPDESKELSSTNAHWRCYECMTLLTKFRANASQIKDNNPVLCKMVWAEIQHMIRAYEEEFIIAPKRTDKRKCEEITVGEE